MSPPFPNVVLDTVDSTNRVAFERAAAGEVGPQWIVARRQTAGRGRAGRQWSSEPGNLYASLLIKLSCPPMVVPQLSLLSGVAVIEAITNANGGVLPGLRLKWPNDVLIGQAKCAGILAESLMAETAVTAVIGIGINLAWHPTDLGRAATHVAQHGVDVALDKMLSFLDDAMQHWLGKWDNGAGFARVREAWLERAGPVGESCTANTGSERIEGTFAGLDPSGALLLRDLRGWQHTVTFGDVSVAARPPGDAN